MKPINTNEVNIVTVIASPEGVAISFLLGIASPPARGARLRRARNDTFLIAFVIISLFRTFAATFEILYFL